MATPDLKKVLEKQRRRIDGAGPDWAQKMNSKSEAEEAKKMATVAMALAVKSATEVSALARGGCVLLPRSRMITS